MWKLIRKSNEQILCKLRKSESLRLYSIVHVAVETMKTSIFTCQSKSFISTLFTCQVSACEQQPFLAMIWQMTYNHKLPKLCSANLIGQNVGLREGYEGRFTILCIFPQILPRKRACQTAPHIPVPYCKHLWFHHIRVLPSHEHKQYYTKCHTSVMRSLEETKTQDTRQEDVRSEKNEELWLQQWSPSIIV